MTVSFGDSWRPRSAPPRQGCGVCLRRRVGASGSLGLRPAAGAQESTQGNSEYGRQLRRDDWRRRGHGAFRRADDWPSSACQGAAVAAVTGVLQGPVYEVTAQSTSLQNDTGCGTTLWGVARVSSASTRPRRSRLVLSSRFRLPLLLRQSARHGACDAGQRRQAYLQPCQRGG